MTNLQQMEAFQKDFQRTMTAIEEKGKAFEELWEGKLILRQKRKECEKKLKILYLETLRKYLKEVKEAKAREKEEEVFYFTKVQDTHQTFSFYEKSIQEIQERILQKNVEVKEKSETLVKLKFAIEAKQIKLLYELQDIFLIEVRKGAECFIRDIEIPYDLSLPAKDDDVVASGLGYVVHLLLLCSKYLEIPLRYQLLYMGSRSLVRDPIYDSAKDPASTSPLFRRSIGKERFEKAVTWLKSDIEFLLRVRGIEYDPSKHFLTNLQLLFECNSCAKAKI